MKLRLLLLVAAISIVGSAARVEPARRPRYGGTLRVEIAATVSSLDPAAPAANAEEADAKRQIDALIYDANASARSSELTGPFRISEWQPGKLLTLAANEDYRGGRPFLDAVEIQMGRSSRDRIVDLELNKTDFAEIAPEQARRAGERGIHVSASKPDELLALIFPTGRPPTDDARVREAIERSVDRASIVNFILQREGEAAGGALPQWSSGTAFLFPTTADATHAKEIWAQIAPSPKIVLGYDAGDSLEQSVAERIAVNAREAGIVLTVQAIAANEAVAASAADARLIRWSMTSPHPREALAGMQQRLAALGFADPSITGGMAEKATTQQVFEREQMILNGYRIVPIVWLPHVYGLSARVRDWQAPEPGAGWPLADVWLEGNAP
jgi:MarR-like DNA-binding transcriptional regulator SgrR of sgrS sRNA